MPSQRTKDGEKVAIELYCKLLGSDKQVEYPDPPDAIIQLKNGVFDWVEVTSTWPGQSKGQHHSYAAALNNPSGHGKSFGYVENVHTDLIHSIKEKDANKEYEQFLEIYGKGVLIVNLEYAGFDNYVERFILPKDAGCSNLKYFRSIFLHLSRCHEWSNGEVCSFPSRLIPVIGS